MLVRCPKCRVSKDSFDWEGWVLKVVGSLQIHESGEVKSIGPLTAVTTIERGRELKDCYDGVAICTSCGFRGPLDLFDRVYTCALTNAEANDQIKTTHFGTLHIDTRYKDLAELIFNNINALNWRQEL